MGAVPGFAQIEERAPGDDFAPMANKILDQAFEVQQTRLAIHQRHQVDAEHRLHVGMLKEVIEHDLGGFAAAQFNDQAHSVLVGLVP
jgi:hypothetical protein